MHKIKCNSDNLITAALFFVLLAITLMLVNIERKSVVVASNAPVSSYVEVCTSIPAVVPASVSLPICYSFVDEKHVVLDFSAVSDYLENLHVSSLINTVAAKHVLIKPLLSNIYLLLYFPTGSDGEYPSFS